jgi:hypothetical protein
MVEATKYIAYISLDFLNKVFADYGLQGNVKEQDKFIVKLMNDVNNFIRTGDDAVLKSWKWYDNNGIEHNAIELMPVRVSDEDALFVSKEQWEELKKILTAQNRKED